MPLFNLIKSFFRNKCYYFLLFPFFCLKKIHIWTIYSKLQFCFFLQRDTYLKAGWHSDQISAADLANRQETRFWSIVPLGTLFWQKIRMIIKQNLILVKSTRTEIVFNFPGISKRSLSSLNPADWQLLLVNYFFGLFLKVEEVLNNNLLLVQ